MHAKLFAKAYGFETLRQIGCVERAYWSGEKQIKEKRYFITSLSRNRLSARRFLKVVTDHWQVENTLHNVKDKHLNEDRQYTARAPLGSIQSFLRVLSMNALRLISIPNLLKCRSQSAKSKYLLAEPEKALKLISMI